jgi:hypothetical protein
MPRQLDLGTLCNKPYHDQYEHEAARSVLDCRNEILVPQTYNYLLKPGFIANRLRRLHGRR